MKSLSSALCPVQPCVLRRQQWASHPNLQNFTNKSLLLLPLTPSLSLKQTPSCSTPLSVFAHAATVCLLFHLSIKRGAKNRSNFSPIQLLASRAGSRDVQARVSDCLWFHILGCNKICVWVVSENNHVLSWLCLFTASLWAVQCLYRLFPDFISPPLLSRVNLHPFSYLFLQ